MKKYIRWPTVCTRCGSLHHLAKDCDMLQKFGVSLCEREIERQRKEGNWALFLAFVSLVGLHILLSLLLGVSP